MSLNYVTVTWDEQDIGAAPLGGYVSFQMSALVADSADGVDIHPLPARPYFFTGGTGTSDPLVANDNASLAPSGSYYTVTVAIRGEQPYSFVALLNYANGASQSLAFLIANQAVPAAAYAQFLPLPLGSPAAGDVPVISQTGSTITVWGPGGGAANPMTAPGDMTFGGAAGLPTRLGGNAAATRKFLRELGTGTAATAPVWDTLLVTDIPGIVVPVPLPAGATATDTPAITNAISSLTAALSFGPATLLFADGTYQIDSNSAVIQSAHNFAVRSSGRTNITQAPNRLAMPNNTAGDLFVIADCSNFRVEDITLDCLRDTVAPLTPLTATAAAGQATVTVAAGQGANYVVGQNMSVYGAPGTADTAKVDGVNTPPLIITAISAGTGAGGGDVITFSRNLANTYSVIGGTALSDGFGPYAWTSDYLSPYEAYGISNTVAGRTQMKGEDQQNTLHLLSCTRFTISRVTARNCWSSQIKCGSGFAPSSLTDGCSQGTISDCTVYHGYDQGVSLWGGSDITVTGNVSNASGWGGIVTFSANSCTIVGNTIVAPVYTTPPNVGNGNGIAIQGGSRNVVAGNVIDSPMQNGIYVMNQGPGVTGAPPSGVTTTAYLPMQTAAGTPVAVSASAGFVTGSQLSIIDGYRTEIVYIASIADSAHITFTSPTRFPHPANCSIGYSFAEDTVVSGNSIYNAYSNGIFNQAVRSLIEGNTITATALRNTAAGSGILNTSSGWGSVITGNQVGGGRGASLTMWSCDHMVVTGNIISGPAVGTGYAVDCQNFNDSVFSGNRVSDGLSSAVRLGGTSTNRSTFANNLVTRFMGDGLSFSAAGQGNTITGNTISSCYGTAGINLNGMQYSTISGNTCSGNHASGIQLNNSGSTYCMFNTIAGNVCRDDGSGVRIDTGVASVQQYGIRELGNSNNNLITGNECDGNSNGQIVTVGASTYAWANIISGAIAAGIAPPQAYFAAAGLTGATAASRWVGATTGGAPVTGTFVTGDWVIDQAGAIWVCTTAGTPGTWTQIGGSAGALLSANNLSDVASVSTARANLGLGTAAVQPATAFDAAGLAAAAQAASDPAGSAAAAFPSTALGDTVYGGAGGVPARLAGNPSATRKFLRGQGSGSAAAAPAWDTLQASDIPAGAIPAWSPVWSPGDDGLVAATFDPVQITTQGAPGAGTITFVRLAVRTTAPVGHVLWAVQGAGSGASTGTYCALFTSNGTTLTQVAASADMASYFLATGQAAVPLSYTPAAPGFLWLAMVWNMATQPTLYTAGSVVQVASGYAAGQRVYGKTGPNASLLSSYAISSLSSQYYGAAGIWAGLAP